MSIRSTLEDALMPDPDGEARAVDRIDTEVLDTGQLRWILWSGGRRIYTRTVDRADLPDMMKATAHLLNVNATAREKGLDHAKADE